MKSASKSMIAIVIACVVGISIGYVPSNAMAARRGGGGKTVRGNSGNTGSNSSNNRQNSAKNAAITAALKVVTADQAELSKAQTALAAVVKPLKAQFDTSPEMTAALAALHDAQAAFKTAEASVQNSLQDNPTYQAAVKKKTAAEDKLEKVRSSGGTMDEITAAANEVLVAGTAVTKLQSAAENSDPKYTQSHNELVAANDKIAALQKQFEQTLHSDSGYVAARKTVDDANAKLASAEAALSSAQAG